VSWVLVVVGYLCGSIPTGVLLARRVGVDVRRSGSGNIGATNVARTAGTALGVATLVADAAKGAVPVVIARATEGSASLAAAVGVAAFLGHVFPVTLGFAGGKGVATALGVLAVLCPLGVACAVGVFAAVVGVLRYVSLGSVLGAAAAPLAIWAVGCPVSVRAAALVMAAIIVLRHRENLGRLRAGTEPRFALHKKQATPGK